MNPDHPPRSRQMNPSSRFCPLSPLFEGRGIPRAEPECLPRGGGQEACPRRNSVTYGSTNYKAIKESNNRTGRDPDPRRFEHPDSGRSEDTEPRSTKGTGVTEKQRVVRAESVSHRHPLPSACRRCVSGDVRDSRSSEARLSATHAVPARQTTRVTDFGGLLWFEWYRSFRRRVA